jgi:hypothetical protein
VIDDRGELIIDGRCEGVALAGMRVTLARMRVVLAGCR